MVLKGTATSVFTNNSAFELILTWTGTQNIAGNSTTINATLTMRSRASWATVSDATASATSITINGNKKTANVSSTLGGNASKTLMTHSVVVPHNANGSKTVTIGASHYFDIYWNGGSPQTPTLSTSYVLDTIARASTGSGSNFTFTGNSSITISRQSSSFTHEATMTIGGTHVKKITGLGTSGTFSFTDAERKILVTGMGRKTSAQVVVSLQTKSGSTNIGSPYTIKYNVTAPAVLSGSIPAFTIGTSGFRINVSNFHTSAGFSFNGKFTWGSFSKNASITSSTPTYPLSQSDVDSMLQAIPNGNTGWGAMVLTSYYQGVAYGSDVTIGSVEGHVNVSANSPTVAGGTTYEDTDASIVNNVTGNNQLIVQNRSSIRVKVPANLGTARGSATLKKIRVTLGGTSKEINYTASATNIDLGTTNANTNSNLVITVIDSRGNTGTWTRAVSILPYTDPQLTPLIVRKDGFEDETTIDIRGTYSRMNIGGADKNAITGIYVRLKKNSDANYGGAISPTNTSSGGKISSPQYTETLDNTYAWDVEIVVHDKLTSATKTVFRLAEGRPAMFVDKEMKSVGVGMFPSKAKMLQVEGGLETTGAVGIGKPNARGTLDVGGNTYIAGSLYLEGGASSVKSTLNWSPPNANPTGVYTHLYRHNGKMLSALYHSTGDDTLGMNMYDQNGNYKINKFLPDGGVNFAGRIWSGSSITATGDINTTNGIILENGKRVTTRTHQEGSLTFQDPNFSPYSPTYSEGQHPKVYTRDGSIVTISGAIKNNIVVASGWSGDIAQLPSWAPLPRNEVNGTAQGSGNSTFLITIRKNGRIVMTRYRNGDTNAAVPVGSWLNVSFTYASNLG